MLTPWQRIYMRAVTPTHPTHVTAVHEMQRWAPSRYRRVRDTLRRLGAIGDDGRPTPAGAEALSRCRT